MKTLRLASILTFLLTSISQAGQLTVAPILLKMSPDQANATLSLTNGASEDGFYQVQLFSWSQQEGKRQLSVQDELVVTPPVTLIPAGGNQTIRLVRTRPVQSNHEQSYRLVVSEIPDTEQQERNAQVQVLLRLSIPVFVGKKTQKPSLRASLSGQTLHITNSGNAHARLTDLAWQDTQGRSHTIQRGLSGYVLPDSQHQWQIPSPAPMDNIDLISFTLNGQSVTLPIGRKP